MCMQITYICVTLSNADPHIFTHSHHGIGSFGRQENTADVYTMYAQMMLVCMVHNASSVIVIRACI